MIEWGDKIEWLQDIAEPGSVAEARLASRPILPAHLAFYWDAFWALSHDRPSGFGAVGRISFASLDRYAARFGVAGIDAFERLRALVGAMDRAFVEHLMKSRKTR